MVTQEQMERYARWEAQDRKMRFVGKVAFWMGAVIVGLTLWTAFDQDAAMKQCQAKGYSYDTCFHSLNR